MTRICLDACVLYPTVLREILLGCAERALYVPIWSSRILEEWARATPKLGPGAEAVACAEIAQLRNTWPQADVAARDRDLGRLVLPDADDVHVLATAIAAGADAICTFNARDFPRHALAAEGVDRVDPDQLLRLFHDTDPGAVEAVVAGVHMTAERLSGEAWPIRQLLKRARLPKLGKRLGT